MRWRGFHLLLRKTVDAAELVRRLVDQMPLVIAAHRRQIEIHQDIGDPVGLERPADQVAEIEGRIDPLPHDIVEHRLQRQAVAVDIGDDGDLHGLGGVSPPALSAATSALSARSSALCVCTSSRNAS